MMNKWKCKICGTSSVDKIIAKEMMHGTGEEFQYNLCNGCECLQIENTPENISNYYGSNYYSFSRKKAGLQIWLKRLKRRIILWNSQRNSLMLRLLEKSHSTFWVYRRMGLQPSHTTLDVGSGSGEHVIELRSVGIEALGVDPFIQEDIYLEGELIVKKAILENIAKNFDLITFHHSLEHIPDQLGTLLTARSLLKPGGKILIRIPTTASWAFQEFKENWFQLDAPRHLFLHSHKSIRLLAKQANLEVEDLWCDSTEMQFIISEQYRKGISLLDSHSYAVSRSQSGWDKRRVLELQERAKSANAELKGDQICVVMSRR